MKTRPSRFFAGLLVAFIVFAPSFSVFAEEAVIPESTSEALVAQESLQEALSETSDPVVAVEAENTATTTNTVTVTADTGSNIATSTDEVATSTNDVATTTPEQTETVITTGDAVSQATVTNVVNVNVYNSDALIAFLNRFAAGDEHVDIRSLLTDTGGIVGCAECTMSTSSLSNTSSVHASTTNNAVVINNVNVQSSTGNNQASGGGDTTILTGNSYANANVVNVVNTNLVDSKYVMLVLNNYGTFGGDIVLPTASFFENFLSNSNTTSNSTASTLIASTTNTATVENTIATNADSGNNTASSTDGSIIQTGDAVSGSTVINTVNENVVNTNSVAIVFRIYGKWTGSAFNVPTHFMWNNTPVGIQFFNDAEGVPGQENGGSTSVHTSNSASIQNAISVGAITGNNQASGAHALVGTGNAYAAANVMNMANTNIVGSNWINAIINIFGDWNGNISFGQPNLWVGTRADIGSKNPSAGTDVTYHYTIKNNGDAPAHNVKIDHRVNDNMMELGNNGVIDIGTLAPGETREISQTAKVAIEIPFGDSVVTNTIKASATETDGNTQDNVDVLSFMVSRAGTPASYTLPPTENPQNPAHFIVTKSHSGSNILTASSTVDYTIVIKNAGGYTEHAVLIDTITSGTGEVIHTEQWDLEAVTEGEEITVTYTAFFNASTTSGIYTNSAKIVSPEGRFPDSVLAKTDITINALPKIAFKPVVIADVLGAFKGPKAIATTTEGMSTTTASTTQEMVQDALERKSQLASVFAALGESKTPWVLMLFLVLGLYILYRTRQIA